MIESNKTDPNIKIPENKSEFFFFLFRKEDSFFSFYVLLLMTLVNVPIILKEAYSKEIKYYSINVPNFPISEIASYTLSLVLMFIFSILIIHANKILIILNEALYLVVEYLKFKFNGTLNTRNEEK